MPYVETGDIRTYYESFGRGPTVVFAHGLGGLLDNETAWAQRAAEMDTRVVLYSLRGHGRTSPSHDPNKYRFDSLAHDLAALLSALGLQRSVVGGASLGAAVALAFALRCPERVDGLIQVAPAFGRGPNELLALGFSALAAVVRERGARAAIQLLANSLGPIAEQAQSDPGFLKELTNQWGSHDRLSFSTALETVPRQSPFASIDDLRAMTAPVLIVSSHDDPIHPLPVAVAYAKRFPHRYMVVARNAALLRERPAAMASLVASFCKQIYG